MLEEIENRVRERKSFAFETTLSGRAYLHKIKEWQGYGYHIKLVFLTLPNPEFALARVAARVAQGGHDIPEEVIRRRFNQGFRNLQQLYQPLVDSWVLYDSSVDPPKKIEWGQK